MIPARSAQRAEISVPHPFRSIIAERVGRRGSSQPAWRLPCDTRKPQGRGTARFGYINCFAPHLYLRHFDEYWRAQSGEPRKGPPLPHPVRKVRPLIDLRPSYDFAVSVIVVSFNTRDLLRDCLQSLLAECARLPQGITSEVLVIDNASSDGSAEMVAREFPDTVRLIRSEINLGFGPANNLAANAARGRYLVLLNSDAFFHPGALALAVARLDADPSIGIGGARLIFPDGSPQPSARTFHSILGTALVLSGITERFASMDKDPNRSADVDWVTGAFMIMRREAIAKTGLFDPAFFLYYEEVDLCRRVKKAGFRVLYWPDVVVTHLGGESSRTIESELVSERHAQVVEWQMRSNFLYFRKHHGWQAWPARWIEETLYILRWLRNLRSTVPGRRDRARDALLHLRLLRQAWRDTRGGRVSPPQPW